MAAAPPPTDVEMEAGCPICMEYLTDPVTLDCGHNYCRGCITSYCDTREELEEDLECPVCRARIQKGNFRPNWQLANIVEQIKHLPLNPEKGSLCVRHKEKLLLFCKDDEELVCWKCKCSPGHKSHTVLLKEEAVQEYKDAIYLHLKILKKEREKILKYQGDIEKENRDLLKQAKVELEKTVAQFKELRQFLEGEERRLLAEMEEVETEIFRERDEHITILSEELSSLENIIREMEEKCQQSASEFLQDIRNTLQRSQKGTSKNPTAFPRELKWRIWDICDKNTFLNVLMRQLKDALLPGIQLQKANVSLDPDTAHPRLILSKGNKSVREGDKSLELPNFPDRFNFNPFVLGCEGLTTGRHFWEVTVGSEEKWAVGVARKSVKRKEWIILCPKEGIWVVGYYGGTYQAFNPPYFPNLSLSGELKKIRVSLFCAGRQVAFYDSDRNTLLYAFSEASFSGDTLLPFFFVHEKACLSIAP